MSFSATYLLCNIHCFLRTLIMCTAHASMPHFEMGNDDALDKSLEMGSLENWTMGGLDNWKQGLGNWKPKKRDNECEIDTPFQLQDNHVHNTTMKCPSELANATYTLGFLPALHDDNKPKHYVGAFLYALQSVQQEWKNKSRCLDYVYHDTGGDHPTTCTIRAMTQQMVAGCVAFIGPERTCVTEASVAAAWSLPMISYKCSDSAVSDKNIYTTFARTVPSTSKVSKSLISIMKHFDWTSFTMVVGSRQDEGKTNWEEAAETLQELAEDNKIRINHKMLFTEPYHGYHDSSANDYVKDKNADEEHEDESSTEYTEAENLTAGIKRIKEIIDKTYAETRIYVFLGDDHALIDFAREMENRGLNKDGKYALIAVQDKPYEIEQKAKYLQKFHESDDEWNVTSPYVQAFRTVMMVMQRAPQGENYKEFLKNTIMMSHNNSVFDVRAPLFNDGIKVSPIADNLYDSVRLYARALDAVLDEGGNAKQGSKILQKIIGRPYNSIRGYEIMIDNNGDAESNYTVVSLKVDGNGRYSLEPVGNFTHAGLALPSFNYDEGSIAWIAKGVPVSEPPCGFDGGKCRYKLNWTVTMVCTVVSLIIIMVLGSFALRHYIYEQKLASLLWKIDFKDLLMTDGDLSETGRLKRRKTPKAYHYGLFSSDDTSIGTDVVVATTKTGNIKIASYKGTLVAVRMLRRKQVELTRAVQKELTILKEMSHENINRFHGACTDPPNLCIVTQYCARGSLKDILENDDLNLDDMFTASLVFDLIKGMIFLHDSEIGYHGNLKSSNTLVDSRWVLQISGFGLHQLQAAELPSIMDEETYYTRFLWTAPELIRNPMTSSHCKQKVDVFSFAIILFEIHGRCGAWGKTFYSSMELIEKVKHPQDGWIIRPDTSQLKCESFVISCMQDCWHEDPDSRPDFKYIRMRLKPMQKGMKSNIFDNMIAIMEKYANNLEAVVAERTDQLSEEKRKTETLLLRMLPKPVAEQLKRGEPVIPEHYEAVTIYFSDICGFTSISAESSPMQVVDLLNDLYTTFDSIIGEYDVYKVETIGLSGDAYVVVSGLPIRNGDNHAGEIASMSLHLLKAIHDFKIRHRPKDKLSLRIGIHSGSCVAGVVGLKMPRYCLFGDTVNTASRMESNGVPLKIHCSVECKNILAKLRGYKLEERGIINLKGKGEVFTYFLVGEDKSERLRRISVETRDSSPEMKNLWSSRDSVCSSASQGSLHSLSSPSSLHPDYMPHSHSRESTSNFCPLIPQPYQHPKNKLQGELKHKVNNGVKIKTSPKIQHMNNSDENCHVGQFNQSKPVDTLVHIDVVHDEQRPNGHASHDSPKSVQSLGKSNNKTSSRSLGNTPVRQKKPCHKRQRTISGQFNHGVAQDDPEGHIITPPYFDDSNRHPEYYHSNSYPGLLSDIEHNSMHGSKSEKDNSTTNENSQNDAWNGDCHGAADNSKTDSGPDTINIRQNGHVHFTVGDTIIGLNL